MKVRSTPKLEELAGRCFEELTSIAQRGETNTYKDMGESIGAHYFCTLPRVLGLIWDWCEQERFPHINALVVSKNSGVPGDGYQPSNRPTSMHGWHELWREVHSFDWSGIAYGQKRKSA